MAMVPAICTQCGAKLIVDDAKETAFCKFCGTAFTTQKAIQMQTITNNTYIANADKVVLENSQSLDNQIKAAETFIKLGDYKKSKDMFRKLTQEYPYDYRTWWGVILSDIKNPQLFVCHSTIENIKATYSNIKHISTQSQISIIENEYHTFISNAETFLCQRISTLENQKKQIDEETHDLICKKNELTKSLDDLHNEYRKKRDSKRKSLTVLFGFLFAIFLVATIYYGFSTIGHLGDKLAWKTFFCGILSLTLSGLSMGAVSFVQNNSSTSNPPEEENISEKITEYEQKIKQLNLKKHDLTQQAERIMK